ncbi:hypothetical protein D3C81_1293760 [compost metagenome]
MVEKRLGSGEHRRPPGHFAVADHADPLALHQGLDDVAVHRHAAHILDFATGDGLAVGDQGQGFQQRARVALRAFFPQAPDPRRKVLANLQAVTAGHLLELEGAAIARLAQQLQSLPEDLGLRSLGFLEQFVQALQGLRLARSQQEGFDQRRQVAGFIQVHQVLQQAPGEAARGWRQKVHSAPVRSAIPSPAQESP